MNKTNVQVLEIKGISEGLELILSDKSTVKLKVSDDNKLELAERIFKWEWVDIERTESGYRVHPHVAILKSQTLFKRNPTPTAFEPSTPDYIPQNVTQQPRPQQRNTVNTVNAGNSLPDDLMFGGGVA